MSRLIDADKLKTEMVKSRQFHAENCRENNLLARCATIVDEQPTVDAVKVVRCKDCKYRAGVDEPNICGVCKLVSNRYCNGEDYCGYGERKGGAE